MRMVGALAVLLSGCLLPQVVPEADSEFIPTGEIQYRGNGASFDAVRVRNPRCNLTKRTDGSWGGTIDVGSMRQPVDVSVTPKKVTGVGLTLVLEEESAENGIVVTGQWQGKILRFEVGPQK